MQFSGTEYIYNTVAITTLYTQTSSSPAETWRPLKNNPSSLPCQALVTSSLLSVSTNLSTLGIFWEWNYTVFVLLCLAYSTEHVSEVKLHCSTRQNFIPFHGSIIFLYGYTPRSSIDGHSGCSTFCLYIVNNAMNDGVHMCHRFL